MSAASHDSIEPSGSSRDWTSLNIWTALILATVLALVTYLLTSGGDPITDRSDVAAAAVGQTTTTTTQAPPSTTVAPAPVELEEPTADEVRVGDLGDNDVPLPVVAQGGGDSLAGASSFTAASESLGIASAGVITNMGPTEVGFTTNFPTVAYNWERIELEAGAAGQSGWLGILNGRFTSIGQTSGGPEGSAAPSLVTAVSADASTWEVAGAYELPEDTWISSIVSDGETVVAFGQVWESRGRDSSVVVLSSTDGVTWSDSDLAIELEPDEHVYLGSAAMGPAGILLSVNFEIYPDEPPVVLSFDPYEVTLDYAAGTFALVDPATGETIVDGFIDEIFNWGVDGQNIFDPESGGLLTTVPWEVWESAWGYGGSPLPLPIDYGLSQSQRSVEYDGFVILIDEGANEYVVTDAATGDEIASGTMEQLYQGLPPTFRDPATGEIILSVTWDEWYQAEEEGYGLRDEGIYYEYSSRTSLLTSADGQAWAEQPVSDGSAGGSASYLIATDGGFVAMVNSYGEFGDSSEVWTMSNGVWSSTSAERSDLWLSKVVVTDGGMVAVGDSSGGQALWSSSDGVSWRSEFAIVPQDDGSYAWLSDVSSADSGLVGALSVKQRWSGYGPLVIEQELYTATFEDGEVLLRVVDNASGDEVLLLGWEAFDGGPAGDLVSWDGEATSIVLDNGDVMVITDEDARAATEIWYSQSGEFGLSVFLADGGTWSEAVVDVDGAISGASQLLLADGKIVIGGSHWDAETQFHEGGGEGNSVIIVGTPIGG